jgi:hypothetical protein
MDRYVTIKPQKENEEIIGRDQYLKNIKSLLETNNSFCVYGALGIGKTFLLEHALSDVNYIELSSENLKSDFLERIKTTRVHVLADDLEVTEPLSRGSTILVSNKIVENFNCMKIEPLVLDDIITIGTKRFPKLSNQYIKRCAIDCKGNIRHFLYLLENFTSKRDLFKSPKDLVYDLVCQDGEVDPRDYIGKHVTEHGYSWGIIHENYTDIPDINIEQMAEYMSHADLKDVDIYNGYSHANIFSLFGVILPAISIDHRLEREHMRPGSAWTKFNNYKMRFRRYQSMTNRKIKSIMDVDSLMVISQYCKNDPNGVIDLLNVYGFESADIDMMNHISLMNKIKPRILQTIKNKLKLNSKE